MIFNMVGGGGGSGATLVVSSPANVSVTVSKDDKSYTKNSGSLGSATFKGLATGTWTVVISGNGQTATRTIEITADYAITIAFFSATINITYPANSNCVVANSGGQTVASNTNTGTSAKTWTATVNAKGTYTITATATDGSGKTKSATVSITAEGQVETVTLSYEFVLLNTSGWASKYAGKIDYTSSVVMTPGKGIVASYDGDGDIVCSQVVIDEVPDFSILQFTYSNVNMNSAYPLRMGLHSVSTLQGYNVDIASATVGNGSGTVEVDISQINTPYYLRITGIYSGVISEIRLR